MSESTNTNPDLKPLTAELKSDHEHSRQDLRALEGFIADLKADRAATKEKERREAWTRYVSLSIVIIAVFAAIATQWAGKYSSRTLVSLNDATFLQAKASDQWSFYQAKSIKQNLYETSHAAAGKPGAGLEGAVDDRIARYEKEKKEIMEQARQFEAERDTARKRADLASVKGGGMGMAVAVFSISIALASICLVTKRKPLWFMALALAAGALAEMIRVWLE